MATVKLRNVSPMGDLDFPLIGRILAFGEEFEVDFEVAGRAPNPDEPNDLGKGLLAQVGNFELASQASTAQNGPQSAPSPGAPSDYPPGAPEGAREPVPGANSGTSDPSTQDQEHTP